MARKIAQSTINASTMDIMNVIRQNASYEYQSMVPVVEKASEIPKVGEVIYGTPAFANQFVNALINRIALVMANSATFNNPYVRLKKGYLEFGETVEEIFVNIAKVVDYSPEKAVAREFKRTLPDIRAAFHVMNWRVMYPVTVQDEDLKLAFLSENGVLDLIAKIVQSIYTASEYDEFLLFKYMLIKAVSHGRFKAIAGGDGTDLKDDAKVFRGVSNIFPFMSDDYNESGVKTTTPKDRQVIFMDAMYNAEFDVDVLASAFNMEKADFMGRLYLIDNWTSFDNERFEVIRENSDGIEEVTAEELAVLSSVKAVILDENWFQVYDNLNKMTENYISAGLYWNYFYHVWKTISSSPFSNAVVIVDSTTDISLPDSLEITIDTKSVSDTATVLTFIANEENVEFVQTEALTTLGIGVQKYGAVLIPSSAFGENITLVARINDIEYTASSTITNATTVDTKVTLAKSEDGDADASSNVVGIGRVGYMRLKS